MRNPDIQKWLFNIAIFSLAVVILGFMFSTGKRIVKNPQKIQLSRVDDAPLVEKPYSYIVLEVLNGCGVTGLAQEFTNYLRQQGFDVIYTSNAENTNFLETKIIERVERTDKSKIVLSVLELDEQKLEHEEDPSRQADFTLIIGKDYKTLDVYSKILKIKEKL